MVILACTKSVDPWAAPSGQPNYALAETALARLAGTPAAQLPTQPAVSNTQGPVLTPTPDQPHPLPTSRSDLEIYVVQPSDTLFLIAQRYQVSVEALIETNELANPDYLEVGQTLTIPAPPPGEIGPSFKIIPDSELIYSPASIDFDVEYFVKTQGGYLASYSEEIDDQSFTGSQIIARIAYEYSVNPRLLLAILEYRSAWVSQSKQSEESQNYPIVRLEAWRKGLYRQLAWTADKLNYGYYAWRVNSISNWILKDGGIVPANPTINAGTAGIQYLLGSLCERPQWLAAVTENGLQATYNTFFGYPFSRTYEPVLPQGLQQPAMQLPFESGFVWAFTGGPHGGWGNGSAWAGLDFAPPGEALGCVISEAWVAAAADGLILRSGNGAVVQDLDILGAPSDGLEQTGWTVLYMHIESRDRVQAGVYLKAGERIGHPSCEGGVSTGTHMHLARRYNGEWIPADQDIPFMMDGWISSGAGKIYDGYLKRNDEVVEAWEGYYPENSIQR